MKLKLQEVKNESWLVYIDFFCFFVRFEEKIKQKRGVAMIEISVTKSVYISPVLSDIYINVSASAETKA